jgi:predicted RNA-binding Zn ribbon-like protein
MSAAAPARPPPTFKFLGGDLALDLVNTVDWTERGPAADRLSDYPRLTAWAEEAGVIRKAEALALRRRAALAPEEAARALGLAHQARGAIQACAAALSAGKDPEAALRFLDALLPRALTHLRLEADRSQDPPGVRPRWDGLGTTLDSPLWPVLWSAVHLFTSPDAARVHLCAGESCGWAYVDRSRNGLRRWCEMSTCGTTAKNRRRGRRPRPAAA